METGFWITIWLTFKLAAVTTFFLLLLGIPLAYGLARSKGRLKPLLEACISLPLVLPPTVLGFYLLIFLSPDGWLGHQLEYHLGWRLLFTFPGLVLGSIIYSLPFMVQPLQSGFEHLPEHLTEASLVLGKSRFETLLKIQLPNMKSSLLTGIVLAFAHTVGEFGVILMIGGNIPGQTRVASIAIYDEVEALNYSLANQYALILVFFALSILTVVYGINHRMAQKKAIGKW
ncbi:MAG TPA: molybdate ABC transporter permease subunit [Saprospiraceae bacterium]|nr:molybdate ABC transporter permease subunit [Saprospiraceae bacterium]HMQ83827.1 molybdate ABC transporter permease subunit [Saprospiraceae bacterium]